MNARKTNILVHRYLGYYFFGLTAIYSISGLAVNHIDEWNPNYILTKKAQVISPFKNVEEPTQAEIEKIFLAFELKKDYNSENIFYPSENTIQVLLSEGEKIIIDTTTNQANYEIVSKRPVLHLFNFLHLNNPKKLWTWYADFYALSLLIIAITGMFMKKGKEGPWGKGGILALAGMLIPFILVWFYY